MTLAVLIIAASLLFEAFFSGSELALISANRVLLRKRGEEGGKLGRAILRFVEDPGPLISTTLVGTNICVVLSTVVTTLLLLPRYPDQAELLSLAVMAPLVLVFGEIVPKSLFQHYADRLAPRLIGIFSALRIAFYPVVLLGTLLSRAALRLLRIDAEPRVMSREELKLLITLPSRGGDDRITVEEKQMISRIFEFSEKTVGDVMLPLSEITAMVISETVPRVAAKIAETRHTRIPLYRERLDQIVGIVHAFDVLRAAESDDLPSLCRPAIFVPANQPAVDTLVRLQREGQGMAIVVDEYGGAIGAVTIEDILEEIVGEIADEYDREPHELIRRGTDGTLIVKGRASVENLNDFAGIDLPVHEDYETVAGLVLDQLKVIPKAGRQVALGDAVITVTEVTDRAVEEVRVVLRPRPVQTSDDEAP